MVVIEACRCLRDRVELAAQRGPGHAVGGVCVARGNNIRVRAMNGGVQHKTCTVDCPGAFHDFSGMVDQQQIRHSNPTKIHGKRIGPVQVCMFRVAQGDVPGKAVLITKLCEHTADSRQALLAVQALISKIGEGRRLRKIKTRLLWLVDRAARRRCGDGVHGLT